MEKKISWILLQENFKLKLRKNQIKASFSRKSVVKRFYTWKIKFFDISSQKKKINNFLRKRQKVKSD